MPFVLDPTLRQDCHLLGKNGTIHLLLNRNALFPWFILVPETHEIELYKLKPVQQGELLELINALSRFVKNHFRVDKLNIASIGNVVSQLHVHMIGRHHADPCWPNVVWGTDRFAEYASAVVTEITANLYKERLCEPL